MIYRNGRNERNVGLMGMIRECPGSFLEAPYGRVGLEFSPGLPLACTSALVIRSSTISVPAPSPLPTFRPHRGGSTGVIRRGSGSGP